MENGAIAGGAYRRLPLRMPSAQSRVRVLTPTNHSCSEDDYVGACAHSATAEQVTITVAEPCRKNDPAILALGVGGVLVLEAAKTGWLRN